MGASKYPISLLISEIISDRASCEADFITNVLGYRDVTRGLNRLHLWTGPGEGHQRIISQIARATGRGEELNRAIAETRDMKEREREQAWLEQCQGEAETFRPFLYAVGSHAVPEGICIFGLTGGHRRWTIINVPQSVLDLPEQEQLPALAPFMDEYREKHGGKAPFFGLLTGFRFVRLVHYFQFDADGHLVEIVNKPFRPGDCSVWLT